MQKAILILITTALIACSDETMQNDNNWLIPVDEVFDGGPGKDGIPSIDNPQFNKAGNLETMDNDQLMLVIKVGNTVRAYSHDILDWHEIVNDEINGSFVAITYCPLTGTGIGWGREIDGTVTTFGVSGLLYNTNLIPYDRQTESNWSQQQLACVQGELKGTKPETYTLLETKWQTLRAMYPDADVLSTNTGFNRVYGEYPYGDYIINNDKLFFPISNTDERLPQKERVLGVITDQKEKVYSIELFADKNRLIKDDNLVIIGSKGKNYIVAFQDQTSNGESFNFTVVQDELPVIMIDDAGSKWDIFGEAVDGPNQGKQLVKTKSFIGYWFSWATFYPDVEIYE